MKTLKLTLLESTVESYYMRQSNHYYGGSILMAIIPMPAKDGNVRLQTKYLYSCREDVAHYYVRTRVQRSKANPEWFNKTCVIHYINYTGEKDYALGVECAIKTINAIEKTYGWPLTRAYKLSCDQVTKPHKFFYFEGPSRWIYSPQLISLYLLLLRMGYSVASPSVASRLLKMKTLDTVGDFWAKGNFRSNDVYRFRQVYKEIPKLLGNYDKLFGSRTMRALYSPGGYVRNEGVEKFLRETSNDNVLNKAWREIK